MDGLPYAAALGLFNSATKNRSDVGRFAASSGR